MKRLRSIAPFTMAWAISPFASFAWAQTEPATAPTTTSQPATTQASADVSPEAAPVLERLSAVYVRHEPMIFSGTIAGDFDVAGRSKTYTLQISGRTDGDGRFFHYGRDAGLVVSDGKNGYLYDERHNAFADLQVSPGRPAHADLDSAISDVLIDENPALLLTLTQDPTALLRQIAKAIYLPSSGVISALTLELPTKRITLELDPTTSGITRSTIDYTPLMKARSANGVKHAAAVLTYAPRAAATAVPPDFFTWAPPATASQFTLQSELLRSEMQRGNPRKPPEK